jgi:hypothetical protein
MEPSAVLDAAARLREQAWTLRIRADRIATHAPDPGAAPAARAVSDVQTAALLSLRRLAAQLSRTADDLEAAVVRTASAEHDVARLLRLPPPRPGPGT